MKAIMPINTIDGLKEASTVGGLGLFGGCAYFLYLVSKGQKFTWSMFFINLFLAFFIGYVVGQFIGPDISFRDGVIAISGFTSFPLLSLLEKRGASIAEKYIGLNDK